MNLKNYNLLILIFITGFIISCKTTKTEIANSQFKPLENSLLWKIESDSLSSSSYLFGTIHILKKSDYFIPKGFQKAFDNAENLTFEIDMKEINNPATIMGILPKIMMKGDTSIRDLISDEDFKLLQQHFKKKGIPLFLFEKVKPMFLSMFAEVDLDQNSLDNGEYISYEMEMMKKAEEKNKTISGLETIDYQISIFDSIPYFEQAKMLMDGIKTVESDSSQLDQLVKIYKQQDINAMQQSIKSDDISKYEKLLLQNRNKNWIPVMDSMMKKQPVLFLVGAGHLGGKDGVINLLRKKGYRVSAVRE